MDKKNKEKQSVKTVKQCVIVAESLDADFTNPNVFLTLNSVPAIEYTLHWLSEGGVQQVFIFYSKTQVEEYLQQNQTIFQKYLQSRLKIRSYYVKQQQLKGIGDIIRQIFLRDIINEDFLLLFGDTVTNMNLGELVANHIKAKNQLKDVIITTVLRNERGKMLHVLNSTTRQILQIENDENQQFALNRQKINLKKINIDIRRDLSPAQVYMCTLECVKNFKQNFEYSSMRDFINGTLTSQMSDDKINTHILPNNQHCFRLCKSADYYLCYMHYIMRNLYPYTIENSSNISIQKYKTGKQTFSEPIVGNYNKVVKRGSTAVLTNKKVKLSHNIFIGQDTKIGNNCQIVKSAIGSNCIIKDGCEIRYCILKNGCMIGQNSKYEYCLIEKVQESIKVHPFKEYVVENGLELIDRQIFLETPDNQEISLQEQLSSLMSGDIDETLSEDLNYMRKQRNIKLNEFTKEMLINVNPVGLQGARGFSQKWGEVIKLMHDNDEIEMTRSLAYSCLNIKKYEKAVHVFIQCFYGSDLLSLDNFQKWYDQYKNLPQKQEFTVKKCGEVLAVLKQQDEEDGQDDSDD